MTIIGHSESFSTNLVGKVGKSAEQSKLDVPDHLEPLLWEKFGKSTEWPKLFILNHFRPLWWEKIDKSAE